MRCLIGLGSNLGERRLNLERAAGALRTISQNQHLKTSSIYENPAVVPVGAPLDWQIRFLNAVVEIEWQESAQALLNALKKIEHDMERQPSARWAPRIIDLDIISMGDLIVEKEDLTVPHPEAWERSFVLAPIKDLHADLLFPQKTQTVLTRSRDLPLCSPLWMGIVNLTPDSFSDGGQFDQPGHFARAMNEFLSEGVQVIDFGAESTRPGATPVTPELEWQRLKPALDSARDHFRSLFFKPKISVDTRHVEVAKLALGAGCDWINDVSGLADPRMLDLVSTSGCDYVLMHSLSVPADRAKTLDLALDPVAEIKRWAIEKIAMIKKAGISLERVVFDPGIGFGKTAVQSLNILRRIGEFDDLPVRIMIGHSRKSYMSQWAERPSHERDWEGVGTSLALAHAGVDVLRVHEPILHMRAHRAYQETIA